MYVPLRFHHVTQLTIIRRYIKVRLLFSLSRTFLILQQQEDLIIPQVRASFTQALSRRQLSQHYTFYDFIVNKARGKSGPLFNFDVHDDVRLLADATVEKDEVSVPLFYIFQVGVDHVPLLLVSSRIFTTQTHGLGLRPHSPLVARWQGGGEKLVPAQQAYLPSVPLGGFRPGEELRKIHNRVASTNAPLCVFLLSYSLQSTSSSQGTKLR